MKKFFIISLTCIIMFIFCGCPSRIEYDKDLITSWDNINQEINKPNDWNRLVENIDLFQLGEDITYSHNSVLKTSSMTKSDYTYYTGSYGTFPAIDGSTVLLPLAAEFGWQFLDLSYRNTRSFFNFSTTHNAYYKLIGVSQNNNTSGLLLHYSHEETSENKKFKTTYYNAHQFSKQPDIIFATSPSAEELATANRYGVELIIEPVCYDSFVFITRIDNPVDSLTIEQIQDIYSGRIRNWSEVGGNDEIITAYQREAGSGSQTAMEEMVMNGRRMMKPPMDRQIGSMGRLIENVSEYKNNSNSIGYTFKYYVDRLYINEGVKILKIDGIEPNDNNVRNSSYPFIAPYNGVIRSTDVDNIGGKFLNWMLSEEGQRCIAQAGYVSAMSL